MHPHTYKIRLLFRHDEMNFTEVRNTLVDISGIHLRPAANFGEDRYMHTGQRLEGQYKDSRLSFSFEEHDEWTKSEERDSSEVVAEILEKLRPHKDLLNELASKGCDMDIIVSVGVEQNTSVTVVPELAKELVEMNMNLSYDLYPPDKVV